MADQKPTEEKKDELSLGQELRSKSIRDIIAEGEREKRAHDTTGEETGKSAGEEHNGDKPQGEGQPEEKPVPPTATPEAPKESDEEREDRRRKEAAELAAQTAAQVLAKAREEERELQAAAAKEQANAERKKADDASLKPRWLSDPNAQKDANGNPIPASYEEFQSETVRIAKEMALREMRQEQETQRAEQQQRTTLLQEQQQAKQASLDKQITDELADLYATGKLPRIKNENDPNDEGVAARKALFETGVRVNQERIAKGEPPLTSMKLLFYEHYKAPKQQPAGHDAPVAGNGTPAASGGDDEEYDWAKHHKMSMRQLIAEEKRKAIQRLRRG